MAKSEANAVAFGSDRMWGLEELAPPEPVSWLPATPAWLVVAALVLALLAWLVWRRVEQYRRARFRREALAHIDAMRAEPARIVELPRVLRAAALASHPRDEVAGLRGDAWIAWLNANGARFEDEDVEWLDRLPYEPGVCEALAPEVAARLLETSRSWVRGQHARL